MNSLAKLLKARSIGINFQTNYVFTLEPLKSGDGWEIVIKETGSDDRDNLARLTPPLHIITNPRFIEGWHFLILITQVK